MLRESQWLGFARTVSAWPMPLIVGMLLGLVFAIAWIVRKEHAELQRTQSELIAAAKMESVGRLATGVAHEVKNPLMTLSLGADYFLSRRTEKPDEIQLAQDMKEAIHRASSVINILLDYARPRPLQRTSHAVIQH